jgi:hypothetical protein
MPTRAARIWNGTAWEDLAAPVGVAPVKYQGTAPSLPQTGDIWIDTTNVTATGIPSSYQATAPVNPSIGDIWIESDLDVPSVGQNLSYRWRRIAVGGETTLSGNDSSGLPLSYTPGYEQFFLNGMLLYRGDDYTATTGTTITGFPALIAGDVIEVLTIKAEPIGNTYTQAQADEKFVSKIESGTVAKVFSTKLNLTQAVYGTTGYNFYNQTYTTNSKVASKLLITFGVAYEFNTASDNIQLAVSLNGTDEFTFQDTSNSAVYNEMPFYTFISTNSYAPGTTISNLRVYIKSLSGTVVCPRVAGTLHNFYLTVQEIAA